MTHQKPTHHTERGRSLLESSSIASQQRQMSNSPDDTIRAPSFSSTSSHERPSSSGKHAQNSRSFPPLDSSSTLAQFSFAPATQTTVVTTTTTTTTKFPPIIMRAPRHIRDIDPKRFPLAATPTPPSLRKLCFNVAGKPSVFTEVEDANSALERIQEEHQTLRTSNGAIRIVERTEAPFDPTSSRFPTPFPPSQHQIVERPVSPESIVEEDDPTPPSYSSSFVHPGSSADRQNNNSLPRRPLDNPARQRVAQTSNPETPESESRQLHRLRRRVVLETGPSSTSIDRKPARSQVEQQQTPQSLEGRTLLPRPRRRYLNGESSPPINPRRPTPASHQLDVDGTQSQPLPEDVVPTPPLQFNDHQPPTIPTSRRTPSAIPSRLNVSDNSGGTDGSLPSPSLSPVTAAANLQNAGYFADVDSGSEQTILPDPRDVNEDLDLDETFSPSRFGSPLKSSASRAVEPLRSFHPPAASIHDIPAMIDFFEAIPDELKSYVMHQLLRRCPKPTLHIVADVVNPALKCDFLGVLPLELALNIVKFLDLRSMCRASQVSKKWRRLINSDEKHWKALFDADGLVLPDGELQRAIAEGWGWQDPWDADGFEKDLSTKPSSTAEQNRPSSGSSISGPVRKLASHPTGRRSKRKATSRLSNRSKIAKRHDFSADAIDETYAANWMSQAASSEGPYNAANAAAAAVPFPQVGVPSLKNMHLFKSLYRRHHLIRKNWLQTDAKPRHIAFRAHENHVVTCLQFDTNKILTGSDDNNINVYDTSTGAIRAKLRGHEGGVWALQYEGNTLVSGSTDRSVRVWDIERGVQTQVFRGHTSTVRCLQILLPTPTGDRIDGKAVMMPKVPLIITGSRDSNLRVWKLPMPGDPEYFQEDSPMEDTDCPYFVRTLIGHQHSVRAIAAHADTLVSGSYDCTVRVWKISTGETVHRLQGHAQKVYSVVLDHHRNRCISGSMDNMVRIWNLDTGSILYTLEGHSSLVGLLDLRDQRLVSAAADSTLRIWDPENGQCKATLSAHTGAITCFQHDAQKVISGSDRTLKMWNVRTGECVRDLLSELSGVWQVKFNERRCVAAVQRENMTYIEVLDYGAARDGVPEAKRGHRIVVDAEGAEVDDREAFVDADDDVSA